MLGAYRPHRGGAGEPAAPASTVNGWTNHLSRLRCAEPIGSTCHQTSGWTCGLNSNRHLLAHFPTQAVILIWCPDLQVYYDPSRTSYDRLLELFFERVDPTTKDRQGNDAGSQYRSGIYYHNDEQKAAAEKVWVRCTQKARRQQGSSTQHLLAQQDPGRATSPYASPSASMAEMCLVLNTQAIQAVNEKLKSNVFRRVLGSEVVTELKPAGDYWLAEKYHQQVLHPIPSLECGTVCATQFVPMSSSACSCRLPLCNVHCRHIISIRQPSSLVCLLSCSTLRRVARTQPRALRTASAAMAEGLDPDSAVA